MVVEEEGGMVEEGMVEDFTARTVEIGDYRAGQRLPKLSKLSKPPKATTSASTTPCNE